MTNHDLVRMRRAQECDLDDLESVSDAIRGLQSTDHPSLLPLHDLLMSRYRQLKKKNPEEPAKGFGYKTTYEVVLLSAYTVDFEDLAAIHTAIVDGDCLGDFWVKESRKVDKEEMHQLSRLLRGQCPDPEGGEG